MAIYSCRTLKDYHPEAHVTLFTHKSFVDEDSKIFDTVITNIPNHYRTKLWCLPRTPYEQTVYIDCDSLIFHRDIKKMHDFLSNCDVSFGPCFSYTTSDFKWAFIDKAKTIVPDYHGSVVVYNNKPETLDFMQTWCDEYIKQVRSPWPHEDVVYKEWKVFDMFTLWRMTSGTCPEFDRFNSLVINKFPARYNITNQHLLEHKTDRFVIVQVDRTVWAKLESVWPNIQRKIQNAKHTLEKRPVGALLDQFD